MHLNTFVQSYDIASEALNNFKKKPIHVLTDANVLVLIDTDQSIFVNGRFSPTNKVCIAPLIFEHRKFSGNSFNLGNFRFLKKLPVFFYFLNILPSFSKMYEGIYLVFIRSLCIFVDILTICYTFIHFR